MYRRPKFLEILLEVRREMAHEADYDVDLFAKTARTGARQTTARSRPVTRVVTGEDDSRRTLRPARSGRRSAVRK